MAVDIKPVQWTVVVPLSYRLRQILLETDAGGRFLAGTEFVDP